VPPAPTSTAGAPASAATTAAASALAPEAEAAVTSVAQPAAEAVALSPAASAEPSVAPEHSTEAADASSSQATTSQATTSQANATTSADAPVAAAPAPVVPALPAHAPAPLESPVRAPAAAVPQDLFASQEPPRWLVVARQYPVLWMVVAPVTLALLVITVFWILNPPHRVEAAVEASRAPSGTAEAAGDAAPARAAAADAAPVAAPAAPAAVDLAALEAKPAGTLKAAELLQLDEGRAARKRQAAQTLALKLREQPDAAKDGTTQSELLRLAADPDTESEALAAIAQAPAPIGADLLFELSTSKSVSRETNQLAAELLTSVDVRPTASVALAVALDLRAAESCEAAAALLSRAEADGDRRSAVGLAKLASRRGCGAQKAQDCYACLRGRTKELLAAQKAVKSRRAPVYPTP
jgi:hypothetical protein